MLEIVSFTLGPAQTNAYLVADSETREAAVIDPAWDGPVILAEAKKRGCWIRPGAYPTANFGVNRFETQRVHADTLNAGGLWNAEGFSLIYGCCPPRPRLHELISLTDEGGL